MELQVGYLFLKLRLGEIFYLWEKLLRVAPSIREHDITALSNISLGKSLREKRL